MVRPPEIEIDSSLLMDPEPTGSITSPFWRPIPPPPRLPSLPTLPPAAPWRAPSGDRPPSRPTVLSTRPPARARLEDATRPDIRPLRHREPSTAPRRTLLDAASPSYGPATWSVPPERAVTARPEARAAGLGVLAGVLLFACAWIVASPSSAAAAARGVVTVTDTRGTALRNVQVLVDGAPSCETTPCSIELEPGAHQIDVVNLSNDQRAGRSVSLAKGERAALHFALPNELVAKAPAATPPPAPGPDEPISVTALAREEAPAATKLELPRAPAAPTRAVGGALLNLNSVPISNVVLDGRPVGSTPLLGVQVSPGPHSVTFVHPELGRRSATIEVGLGERKAVVVRFQ